MSAGEEAAAAAYVEASVGRTDGLGRWNRDLDHDCITSGSGLCR